MEGQGRVPLQAPGGGAMFRPHLSFVLGIGQEVSLEHELEPGGAPEAGVPLASRDQDGAVESDRRSAVDCASLGNRSCSGADLALLIW